MYKQLLDNVEKDMTLNPSNMEPSNSEIALRGRIDMLQKTLAGYKELNAENAINQQLSASTVENIDSVKAYEHIKKELDTLREDNERLRRRKEELELQLEHRCLKGDFNVDKYKGVAFKDSPSAQAFKDSENIIEKLQAEVCIISK